MLRPLVAGSPTARASFDLMNGRSVVTLPTPEAGDPYEDALDVLARLARIYWGHAVVSLPVPDRSFMGPYAEHFASALRERGLTTLRGWDGMFRVKAGPEDRASVFTIRVDPVERWLAADLNVDLVILDARIVPELFDRPGPARFEQVLALTRSEGPWPELDRSARGRMPGGWGSTPLEVTLAGAP